MNRDLLKQAAEVLTPSGIFLRNSKVYTHPEFHPQHEQKDLQVQYKSRHLEKYNFMQDAENALVIFQYETGVRLVDDSLNEKEEGFIQVEIVANFSSEYLLADVDAFDEEAMSEFLNCNVRFHVWPFWREYLQSTCTRMGLPVIPLPHHFRPLEKTNETRSLSDLTPSSGEIVAG